LTSPSEVARQYLARLFNALASLSAGNYNSSCAGLFVVVVVVVVVRVLFVIFIAVL